MNHKSVPAIGQPVSHDDQDAEEREAACPPPPVLAAWIEQRGFDVCPWLPAPIEKVRPIPGQDAYRFGRLRLARVPLDSHSDSSQSDGENDGTRYYAAFQLNSRPGQRYGQSIGYWYVASGRQMQQRKCTDSKRTE